MPNNILVRDASGNLVTMRTLEAAGVHTPYQTVSSVDKKFRDSFPGPAIDATKWDVTQGSSAAAAANNGLLVMTSGTVANDQVSLITKEFFTVPFRLSFNLFLNQRIANQEFIVEMVSIDPDTGLPDGKHSAGFVFDSTTATSAKYRVQNSSLTPLVSGLVTFVTTASPGGVYELEPFADECWFHSGTMDSTAARSNSYRRHQQIPDPNALYKIRIRWINAATAPASSTTASLQFVAVQDYQELTAEITAGRGQTSAGQAIATAVVSMPTVAVNNTAQNNVFYNESATNQAASATLTGASRDTSVAAGTVHRYSRFNASVWANQAGSLRIECSNDNSTWRAITIDTAVPANTPTVLTVPIMTRYHRAVFINGATANTAFMFNTSYTAA